MNREQTVFGDRRGNVAMLTTLAAPVFVMLLGLSVDFTIKMDVKSLLQNSLDGALLAAAHTKDPGERNAIATHYAQQNFAGKYDATSLGVSVTEGAKGELFGEATIYVPNFFGGFFGAPESTVTVTGAVRTDSPPLEVMLVLDKTGSMAGAKLDALKSSANAMIDKIMDGDKVRVGVIPFARYVNLGMGLRNEPGFDIPADYQTCGMESVPHWSNPHNCHLVTSTCSGPDGGASYSCSWNQCDYDVTYTTENVCHDHKWYGCVGSRPDPLNLEDSATATPVPGLLDIGCGGNPITRMTKDKATVAAAINGLSAEGETYIPAGLMMGWHAITNRPILPDGADPDAVSGKIISQAIILMTDGANTASRTPNQPYHEGADAADADNATRRLCENIKADKIAIYTVAFDVTDNNIKKILQDCASDPANAFDAANASQLDAAFDAIGDSLSRIRLSR